MDERQYVSFTAAVGMLIRAGMADTYQEAARLYANRLVFIRCNMVTRQSVEDLIHNQ